MKMTQIYLEEKFYSYLKEKSLKTGKTISELIKEKFKKDINQNKDNLIKNIEEVAGIWSYQDEDVEKTIRELRRGERVDSF